MTSKNKQARKRAYVLCWTSATTGTEQRSLYKSATDPVGTDPNVRAAMGPRGGYAIGPFRTYAAARLCREYRGPIARSIQFFEERARGTFCDSCELAVINGVVAHEHGCPNAQRAECES